MSKDLEDMTEMVDGFIALAKLARAAERAAIIVWLRSDPSFKEFGMEATWIADSLELNKDKEESHG